MKKRLCWILVVTILCALPGAALAGGEDRWSAALRFDDPVLYAVDNGGIWYCEGGEIRYREYSGEEARTVVSMEGIAHIAAANALLYVLTQTDEGAAVRGISINGKEITWVHLPDGRFPRQIEVDGLTVYYLAADEADSADGHSHAEASVYSISAQGYTPEELLSIEGWENRGVSAIAIWDGILYAYSDTEHEIAAIDLQKGKLAFPPVEAINIAYIQAGDSPERALALSGGQPADLYLIDLQTGEKTEYGTGVPEGLMGLRRSRENLYSLSASGTTLYAMPLPESAEDKGKKTLTIINSLKEGGPRIDKALDLFHERYPDTKVRFRFIDDQRVMATALMSGVEGYDIVNFQEGFSDVCFRMLLKSGAIRNLSEYPEITGHMDSYLSLFDAVTEDRRLYGVPERIIPYVWEVNESLAAEAGIEIPRKGFTWEVFFALADELEAYAADTGRQLYLLQDDMFLPYFLTQYNCNTVDVSAGTAGFDAPEFAANLERWRDICSRGLVNEENIDRDEPLEDSLFRVLWFHYYGMEDFSLILPPVFDEETRYPVNYYLSALSAHAADPEEGAYFLACCLNPEAILAEDLQVEGQWLKDISRYSVVDGRQPMSEENAAIWTTMLENSVQDFYIGDLYQDQFSVLYPKLLEGEITAEQYAAECQRRAEFVLGE